MLILPYLQESALYDRLDLTKPWDDPANLAITQAFMPTFYTCPSDTQVEPFSTNYVVIVDPNSAFPPGGESRGMGEIPDDVSNTLAVVETFGAGVHWAEPTDLQISSLGTLGSDHTGGIFVASYLDGHVVSIPTNSLSTVRSHVIVNDGQ